MTGLRTTVLQDEDDYDAEKGIKQSINQSIKQFLGGLSSGTTARVLGLPETVS